MKTWFATRENECTAKLRAILESHEANLDERFVEESKFHAERRDDFVIFENDDSKVDFWSSTSFHKETPRPKKKAVANPKTESRVFEVNQVVIFKDPFDPKGKNEFTGRVIEAPIDCKMDIPIHKRRGSSVPATTVRRGDSSNGFYKIKVIEEYVMHELLQAETWEVERVLSNLLNATRKRKSRRKRQGVRYELVPVDQIESLLENKERKLRKVLEIGVLRYHRAILHQWVKVTLWLRKEASILAATLKIQGFWRGVIAKRMTFEKRIAAQMLKEQQEKEAEAARLEEEERQRKLEYENYLREHGVTRDGVRFFLNDKEMEEFYEFQMKMCTRLAKQLEYLGTTLKREGFKSWSHYINNVLVPKNIDFDGLCKDVKGVKALLLKELQGLHEEKTGNDGTTVVDELGDIRMKLKQVADIQVERATKARALVNEQRPWHPALGIKLPGLPTTGLHARSNGTIEVLSLDRYNSFKEFQSGPTDYSSYLIKGAYTSVIFGGYPIGQARIKTERITSRSSSIACLLTAGVDTFVCLMEAEELARMKKVHEKGWLFDEEANVFCADIRRELIVGVNACAESLEYAKARAARGRQVGYGRAQQDQLDIAEENRRNDYDKAKAFYDNFTPNLNHIFFPMPKGGVRQRPEEDKQLLDLLVELEQRIRRKERLYIFSQGGSGRAGVVAALLLGRLYGIYPLEALERVQRYHDVQGQYKGRKQSQMESCPRLISQREQVVRLLQYTEPIYDSTITRTQIDNDVVQLSETSLNSRGARTR